MTNIVVPTSTCLTL